MELFWKIDSFTGFFQRFCLDLNNAFFQISLNGCFWSKSSTKVCLVRRICKLLTKWLPQFLRTNELEDARMQSVTRIENLLTWAYYRAHINLRIRECEDTNKKTWTCGYENAAMQGYKQAHMNMSLWRCKDTRIKQTLKNPRIWGCKEISRNTQTWGYENAWMEARAHESEDMRM